MKLLFEVGFISVTIWDILDILIFGYLLYSLYRLLKGGVAFYILLALILLYGLWWLFQFLDMTLMSSMFGQFANIGVILLIVVFQPEIRQFLTMLGSTAARNKIPFIKRFKQFGRMTRMGDTKDTILEEVQGAIMAMAARKTGALIILAREEQLNSFKTTGVKLDARVSQLIIESIFEKNSPMHDGAMIIVRDRIYAASSILPLSYDPGLPLKYGLRHRAAIGASELSDIIAIVISEESGTISYVNRGHITEVKNEDELHEILKQYDF